MPGVARIDDTITTGHGCDATSTVVGPTGATAKVFVNNRAVECKDNPVNSHTILSGIVCVPHSAVIYFKSLFVLCAKRVAERERGCE
jgi:hypothetical protein